MHIDVSYDFQTDAGGKDPDIHSATLRRYHKFLWTKPLPCGRVFTLDDQHPGAYLYHSSDLGEFFLSSDSAIATFIRYKRMSHIIALLDPEESNSFFNLAYTIGGMIIFPANKIDGKATINGARGFSGKIADRLDLTLECIRRSYLGLQNPLASTFDRYKRFFDLFGDFIGYVEFFALQDLIDPSCERVEFFLPFDDFNSSPLPTNVETYICYRQRSMEFLAARNSRIQTLSKMDRSSLECAKAPRP